MHKTGLLKHKLMALLLAGGIVAQPTQAYYSPSLAWDLSIGAGYYLLSDAVLEESVKSSKKATKKSTKTTKPATTTTHKSQTGNRAYEYQYSSKISHQVTDEMMARIGDHLKKQGHYTNQAQQELQALKNSQLIAKVRQALKSEGYNPNSMGTAMAYWIVVNYGVVSGSDLSQLRGHQLVKQLEDAMSTDSALLAKSNAEKQKIADYLYWLASLKIVVHNEALKVGKTAINTSVQESRQALSDMGLSVSDLSNHAGSITIR